MKVKIINRSNNALPAYETAHAAGLDIRAHLSEAISIAPMQRQLIPTVYLLNYPLVTKHKLDHALVWLLKMALRF